MQVKLLTKQKQTHRQRMNLQLLGEKAWWGIDWEFGNNMYTLLYLKQITNKDLQYSIRNSVQYYVIT